VRIRAKTKLGVETEAHATLKRELPQTPEDKLHTLIFGELQEDLQGELVDTTIYKVTVADGSKSRDVKVKGADLVKSNAIVKTVLDKPEGKHHLTEHTKILRLMAANHMAFREELVGTAMPPHHTQVITALLSTQVRPVVTCCTYLLKWIHHLS
jgi:hypothetical protein